MKTHAKTNRPGPSRLQGDTNPVRVPALVDEVLQTSGEPLQAETRSLMERRFGQQPAPIAPTGTTGSTADGSENQADDIASQVVKERPGASQRAVDFSHVRIHADGKSAESSQALNAVAYSEGQHVVFGAERYKPSTPAGQNLLAHELAHTLQAPGQIRRKAAEAEEIETPEVLAVKIREAFRGPGTDEDEVYRVLSFPPDKVRAMINYYNENLNDHTGQGLVEDIKDEFSGDELDKAMRLLANAKMAEHTVEMSTRIESTVKGEPTKMWAGLIVRGMWSKNHEPGVMEQHADVVIPGAEGKMETRGYFGEQRGATASSADLGFGLSGISADMAWFLEHRREYVDLELAKLKDVKSSLILLKVSKAEAEEMDTYWDDLEKDPGTFDILGSNCSTAAAAGFQHAHLSKEIVGLDTPDNLFQQLRKKYPDAFMISGYYGYTRPDLVWEKVGGRPHLSNPGTGSWDGPFVVEKTLD